MRVAIFAFYNKDGKISPYVVYFLSELKKIAERIIFVSDNEVLPIELDKIKDFITLHLCERHGCYDFGSYKRGFILAEKYGLLNDAEELIFCNDSCYGPVYPFEDVFKKMNSRVCDFWGMVSSIQENYHLQSYFLVFKKNVFLSECFRAFVMSFVKQKVFWDYVLKYETTFTDHLCRAGFKCSALINCEDFKSLLGNIPSNVTFYPVSTLKKGLPLIKRKMFGHQHRSLLKESLAEMLSMVKSKNNILYQLIRQETNAVVLIPVYKEELSSDEKSSLQQALRILSRHDIRFVCPNGLDMSHYDKIIGYSLPKERFDSKFFKGIEGYNNLMTDVSFYRRFKSYEYMLIYQLDAWVFSDQLVAWCKKGYDYVGAPWFEAHRTHEEGYPLWTCGNGGLSLRRISKFIEVTNPRTPIQQEKNIVKSMLDAMLGRNNMAQYRKRHAYLWEDTYFCYGLDGTPHEMYRPTPEEAAKFSFECSPKYLYSLIGSKLPFGCHAWRKFQYEDFWTKYINTKKNKISIVTINYNNLSGLQKTYQSIIGQTFKNFEWIVIDGGSSDGSADFIRNHVDEISFWCSERDNGVYNAQNKGTRHAEGDYVIFMNSGDTFNNEHVIENVFREYQDEDILFGDWEQIFPQGNKREIKPASNVDYLFFFNDNICHQAMFIKTSLLKESPYDESYKLYADWAKWAELSQKGKKFKYVPYTICDFQMGGMSSENDEYNTIERERLQKEFYPESLILWTSRQNNKIKFLEAKRRKHNIIIRILLYICFLMLISNIMLLYYLWCR